MFYNVTIDSSAQKAVNLINNLNRTLDSHQMKYKQTGKHRGDNCEVALMLGCIYTYDKWFKETLLIIISS